MRLGVACQPISGRPETIAQLHFGNHGIKPHLLELLQRCTSDAERCGRYRVSRYLRSQSGAIASRNAIFAFRHERRIWMS